MSKCKVVFSGLLHHIVHSSAAVTQCCSSPLSKRKNAWLNSVLLAVIAVFMTACSGGGGGGSSGTSSASSTGDFIITGTVSAPGGVVAFFPHRNFLEKVYDAVFPATYASISGVAPVPDGTEIDLVSIDDAGTVISILASTKTAGGGYSFDFTKLGLTTSSDLAVQVTSQSSGATMRAFVGAGGTVNLDPASEAAVQIVLATIGTTPGSSLSNFTMQELTDTTAAVNLLITTQQLSAATDIGTTVAAFKAAISTNSAIMSFVSAASAPGQTSQGPGDIGNYFPFDQGDTWVYQVTEQSSGQTTNYSDTIQISGTNTVNGVATTIFHETNPGNNGTPRDDYQAKDDRAVTEYGNDDTTDFLTPQLVPYHEYKFPLGLNTSFQPINRSGVTWTQDIDGDGKPETANVTATQTITSFEPVIVPAASYTNAARIVTNLNIIITLSSDGSKTTDDSTITEWYAPDVGLVKSTSIEEIAAQGKTTTTTTTNELTQFIPRLNFSSISAGAYHSCGVTKAGKAYCWGENGGRLGNGSTVDSSEPVAVSGSLTFASVSAGGSHTCGITTDGAAYCWGNNDRGQLGDNTQTSSNVPVPVSGGIVFSSISSGLFHTCGISVTGSAYCWGDNSDGELGYGTLPSIPMPVGPPMPSLVSTVPVPVSSGLTFTLLSASNIYSAGGSYTCGLVTGGAAYCWGSNLMGVLGIGNITLGNSSVPMPVSGGLAFISITTEFTTCAVTPNYATYCWGEQLNNSGTTYIDTPTLVSNNIKFITLSAKGDHVCGVAINGAAYCWGMDSMGQIGNGTAPNYVSTPAAVSGGIQFTSISVGGSHTCGLSTDGTGYCWGWNFWGQLGNGTTVDSSVPVKVMLLP